MRLRSDSAETDGQGGRSAGVRLLNFRKFFRGDQRGQAVANNAASTTDGRQSPKEETPQPPAPTTFKQTFESRQYYEAGQLLIQREERLFAEIKEAAALKRQKEEEEKLIADYNELELCILPILGLSLIPGEVSRETLTSALKAINQEIEQDQRWKQGGGTSPSWRPRGWRELHDAKLRCMVEERMDNPMTPPADPVQQSSIQADILSMGRQLKEDLLTVVGTLKSCYPPEMDICNFYARLYHQNFSVRLRKIAEFVLEDKDCVFLLRWVNNYYPEILSKPELANEIDAKALGKLLPKEFLEPLEEEFLSEQQEELTTYICCVLKEAQEKWSKGEEPTREDGCFTSTVAYDIIQLINGIVTKAETIVGDRQKAQNITCKLKDLMERFRTFQSDIIKQNKENSRPFILANLGCIGQFSDVLRNQSHLFQKDVRESCLLILADMQQSAHTYLLKPVHEALKPQYRKLGTNDWLNKSAFDKLLDSIEQELQDLQCWVESSHQRLIGQLHQEVTTEYVKRLLRGDVKLKDKERQLKAYKTVKDDAESLHHLFHDKGSKENWLTEILTKIAEVLKLQDLPAIQMHVASLGTEYPDISVRHVSALLKLKTNLSRADRKIVKETLTETLGDASYHAARPFFSTVQVK